MNADHTGKNEREAALDCLLDVLEEGHFSGAALERELAGCRTPESRAFLTRLVEGTLERRITIDAVIDSCASVPVKKMKPVIRNILRESIYQILFMDHVADAVAVNEAVMLTKKRGFSGLSRFVNGVLRTAVRQKESFPFLSEETKNTANWLQDTSVRFSVPEWLVRHMEDYAGRDRAEEVFREYLTVRPLQARINRSNADRETVVKSLTADGLLVSDHPYLENVICLKSAKSLTKTEAFLKGWIQIQDAASVLAVDAAGIRPGMRVLDLCAAPGGKSLYAADCGAIVLARDLTERKVRRIAENAERTHLENKIQTEIADARVFDPALEAFADVVIADLPCSGLGVIAKKPDIRYRVRPEDLKSLAALQREILGVAWRYVKPGGVLIYSTCTISTEENERNVSWLLSQEFPLEADDMTAFLPERFCLERRRRRESGKTGELQLFPGAYETDGFFIARFRRKTL